MFKKLFSFRGRIRRLTYMSTLMIHFLFMFLIFYMLSNFGIGLVGSIGAFLISFLLIFVPYFWILLAQGAKRCHDLNRSGWYQLIPFYVFWMLIKSGDAGTNRYGLDPKLTRKEEMDDVLDSLDHI